MCSAPSNGTADNCLEDLSEKERKKIEDRLVQLAEAANTDRSGPLDRAPLRDMPPELAGVKKQKVGRHRVYYTGHHTQCSYTCIYVKIYKKSDVDPEHDRRFQNRLASARADDKTRSIAAKGDEPPQPRP